MDWFEFFKAAGLPTNVASNYADLFKQNRIKESYLIDINKDYLHDMGITVIGDVIAILKHIKTHKLRKDDTPRLSTSSSGDSPIRDMTPPPPSELHFKSDLLPKQTLIQIAGDPVAVANRTLKHFVSKTDTCKLEVPVPTRRRVTPEIEGKYKVSLPKGTTAKTRMILKLLEERKSRKAAISSGKALHSTQVVLDDRKSVFKRLGDFGCSAEPDTTTAGIFSRSEEENLLLPVSKSSSGLLTSSKSDSSLDKKAVLTSLTSSKSSTNLSSTSSSTVFQRLGLVRKRKVTFDVDDESSSDSQEESGPPLPYHGVLKLDPTVPKRSRPTPATAAAPKTAAPITTSAGIFASGSKSVDNVPAKSRLGQLSQPSKSSASNSQPVSSIKQRLGTAQSVSIKASTNQPIATNAQSSSVLQRLGARQS